MTRFSRRRDFGSGELTEAAAALDPFEQFLRWFDDASNDERVTDPDAMTVATVDGRGRPRARVVLLRGVDPDGLFFFTNYESGKGRDLSENPGVALVLYWPALERQIRVEGIAHVATAEDSDRYWGERPFLSRLGAVASAQSSVIGQRSTLEERVERLMQTYSEGSDIPRPATWGGYRVEPDLFEFWQGRRNRLHDRLRYRLIDGAWMRDRLAP